MDDPDDGPVYLLVAVDIEDRDTYARYTAAGREALAGYEFELLSTDGSPTVYEGEQPANHLVIMRFASGAAFERFYRSDAYNRVAKPFRERSGATRFIMTMKPFVAP